MWWTFIPEGWVWRSVMCHAVFQGLPDSAGFGMCRQMCAAARTTILLLPAFMAVMLDSLAWEMASVRLSGSTCVTAAQSLLGCTQLMTTAS